jgi:beta-carotene 3-hydroxylase
MTSLLLGAAAYAGMEGMAWFTHRFVMHGFLWRLHRDHHVRENSRSHLEKNDSFFLIFAIPAMILFGLATLGGTAWALPVAIGITLYGLTYFLVHDVFIHQRIRIFRHTRNRYLLAIRRAHKMHHRHLGKEHGECFGMLWVPLKYFRKSRTDHDVPAG